jgi:hypothetical protein
MDPQIEWESILSDDLWIYNKLFLSRILGYNCGPCGVPVPKSDFYIVRPSMNLLGMGRLARREWVESSTDHLHPAEFWCEIFEGPHISVDFYEKKPVLIVEGIRDPEDPYWKWEKWQKVDKNIKFPAILDNLKGNYSYINCEFIGDNLIEVHFRQNPDFRYNNSIAIPIWDENEEQNGKYKYVKDEDYHRKGFLID